MKKLDKEQVQALLALIAAGAIIAFFALGGARTTKHDRASTPSSTENEAK